MSETSFPCRHLASRCYGLPLWGVGRLGEQQHSGGHRGQGVVQAAGKRDDLRCAASQNNARNSNLKKATSNDAARRATRCKPRGPETFEDYNGMPHGLSVTGTHWHGWHAPGHS